MDVLDKHEIPVFILTANVESNSAQLVAMMFNDKIFKEQITNITAPENYSKKQAEMYRFNIILKEAHKQGYEAIIIIKDTSVSSTAPDTIAHIVKRVVKQRKYDVFYLCNWQSACEHKDVETLPNSTIAIASCDTPDGFQAILLNKKAIDALLDVKNAHEYPVHDHIKKLVDDGTLNSGSTISNIFNFNMTMIKGEADYRKFSACKNRSDISPDTTEVTSTTAITSHMEDVQDTPFADLIGPSTSTPSTANEDIVSYGDDNKDGLLVKRARKRYGRRTGWVILFLILILLIIGLLLFYFVR